MTKKTAKYHNKIMLLTCILFFYGSTLSAQSNISDKENKLNSFSRLVGGEWHLEGSYQVFEWGVGKKSIKAQGFFVKAGKAMLVSEGFWMWHPGENRIKGYFSAIEMPFEMIEYTTKFEGNKMISELKSFMPDGTESNYSETWEFTDTNHYKWSLFSKTPEGVIKIMDGNYIRKYR